MDGPIKICQKDLSYISNSGKIVKGFDQGVILYVGGASTNVIQLNLTPVKMTTAQVIETSITVN